MEIAENSGTNMRQYNMVVELLLLKPKLDELIFFFPVLIQKKERTKKKLIDHNSLSFTTTSKLEMSRQSFGTFRANTHTHTFIVNYRFFFGVFTNTVCF